VLWQNDRSGYLELDQPHSTARARSGVSAQGYLAAAGNTLLVPTGRAIPAAFQRSDGQFKYFHLQKNGKVRPAAFPAILNGLTVTRNELFRTEDGQFILKGMSGSAFAVCTEHFVFAEGRDIKAIERTQLLAEKEVKNKKGKVQKTIVLRGPSWTIPCPEPVGVSLIGAGGTIIVGTKNHKVLTADVKSRSVKRTLEVDGVPLGLAAAHGKLIVSTDRGSIYCFGGARENVAKIIHPVKTSVYGDNSVYAEAAQEILRKTNITKGYCLDLGCGVGRLAYELAQRTKLKVYAVESDPRLVARARQQLDQAGLYGVRVTVLQRDLDATKLPNSFANLIISGRSVTEGSDHLPQDEINRLLRPYGGMLCAGKSDNLQVHRRGPLDQAGSWTHQYCDPANTNCSADERVKAPLGMLWFADNDFEMPSRHGRGPAPLFHNGRLFIEGLHGLRCLDAYNGQVLWEYPLPNLLKDYDQEHLMGVAGTGSNLCVTEDSLYLRIENKCLRLDPATGELLAEFRCPNDPEGKEAVWGYLASIDGMLFGTLADTNHIVTYRFQASDMRNQFTESKLLFALDAYSGELKWSFHPRHSIRNNSIAIGQGRVFLIDRPQALYDRPHPKPQNANSSKQTTGEQQSQPEGILLALNLKTGQSEWSCTEGIYGTMLILSERHDVLLMAYQDTRFKLASEQGGRMSAFRAGSGQKLWEESARYASRPLVNDQTIYAEPGAWDLLTGRRKDFHLKRSYGCGIPSGSRHLLTFRSATLGYYNLLSETETENYGGIRPGCWINAIPAGGLLFLPEASNRCTCSYLIKATIALQPML